MDVIVFRDSTAVAEEGARRVRALLGDKPAAVLGLASGGTPLALYRQLIADCNRGAVSFRDATTFNLDEYLGLSANDPHSYRSYMECELFGQIDIDRGNTYLPACEEGEDPSDVGRRYEDLIRAKGGIDLQVLGIGRNGHIGFNEPMSSLASRTRIKTLTRETLASNRRYFADENTQPRLAITMGIATILDAREIVLLATGARKAAAVQHSVEGPVSAMWPASALHLHERVTVLLDSAAAADLVRRDYYDWVYQQKKRLGVHRDSR